MSAQLALGFERDERPDDPVVWTYRYGLPDRSGLARYVHLRRWRHDPEETKGRGLAADGTMRRGDQRGDWISRRGDAEAWAARILALLADGRPRTFNAIMVHLEGVTADVALETPADEGLWLLVERLAIVWACEEGAVFFLRAEDLEA